eukprot:5073495-Prymnesium_polylepis.1
MSLSASFAFVHPLSRAKTPRAFSASKLVSPTVHRARPLANEANPHATSPPPDAKHPTTTYLEAGKPASRCGQIRGFRAQCA